jgi:hypothetical protein
MGVVYQATLSNGILLKKSEVSEDLHQRLEDEVRYGFKDKVKNYLEQTEIDDIAKSMRNEFKEFLTEVTSQIWFDEDRENLFVFFRNKSVIVTEDDSSDVDLGKLSLTEEEKKYLQLLVGDPEREIKLTLFMSSS